MGHSQLRTDFYCFTFELNSNSGFFALKTEQSSDDFITTKLPNRIVQDEDQITWDGLSSGAASFSVLLIDVSGCLTFISPCFSHIKPKVEFTFALCWLCLSRYLKLGGKLENLFTGCSKKNLDQHFWGKWAWFNVKDYTKLL